jgi:hypothetical protein
MAHLWFIVMIGIPTPTPCRTPSLEVDCVCTHSPRVCISKRGAESPALLAGSRPTTSPYLIRRRNRSPRGASSCTCARLRWAAARVAPAAAGGFPNHSSSLNPLCRSPLSYGARCVAVFPGPSTATWACPWSWGPWGSCLCTRLRAPPILGPPRFYAPP